MNRKEKIDYFLKYLAKIAIQNPNINYNNYEMENFIYHELVFQFTKEQEKKINLDEKNGEKESCFSDWIHTFHRINGIDAFVQDAWPYFCQFISWNPDAELQNNHIKMYIPLDAKHIRTGAKLIFNFLTEENIPHLSKIGKEISFDNIVIRLINREDAENLMSFIKSNKYIQEGLMEPNPFAFQKDGIAIVSDGEKSYNGTVAMAIKLYLGKCQNENSLEQVSYESFYDFLMNQYIMEFIEQIPTPLNEALNLNVNQQERENFKQILQLMIKCQRSDFSFDDFITHYENTLPKETEVLLIKAIDNMSKYYQDYEKGLNSVKAYILTGEQTYLTKENDLRFKILHSPMRNEVRKALVERNITLNDYIKEAFARLNYTPTYNKTY